MTVTSLTRYRSAEIVRKNNPVMIFKIRAAIIDVGDKLKARKELADACTLYEQAQKLGDIIKELESILV